ncbi:GNAT family N-acetyltransferase [Joostella sp. CR20]|uniref:GNAT family N-acetyltransferase n=1 Tax=Joostella sp. CR20 TaxID=2804312 RepID=UPI00313C9ECC
MHIVKIISAQEAQIVRHPVLRPGKPLETAVFPDDALEDTFHVGVVENNEAVGTVTFIKKKNNLFTANNQYQLRGMAVLDVHQKKGFGALMVQKAETVMLEKGGDFIWLNAREIAVPFYKKMGYKIVGDVFQVPEIGPHYLMTKSFSESN